MSLKNVFMTRQRKSSGAISVIPSLEAYLNKKQEEENFRAPNVISPSSAGSCPRELVLNRFIPRDKVDPRVQRIFDNGTDVHLRFQKYLKKSRLLLMDEVPLRNDEYNVQGHTDGYISGLKPLPDEWYEILELKDTQPLYEYLESNPFKSIQILEIKSINDGNYKSLRTAKEEHKNQATTYAWCAEERRKHLKKKYPTWDEFKLSTSERARYFRRIHEHLPPKYRLDKVWECLLSDAILYATQTPVDRSIFLYENKNDQSIKEFVLKLEEERIKWLKKDFATIEQSVRKIRAVMKAMRITTPDFIGVLGKLLPDMPEEAKGRTCSLCKFCPHKSICYLPGGRGRRG